MKANKAHFHSREISFHDFSLRILRNNFTLKELNYNEIERAVISRGFLLKNTILIVLFCLGLIYIGLSFLNYGYDQLHNENMTTHLWLSYFFNRGSVISTWGPSLLVIAGISGIYASFIRTHIITVYAKGSVYRLRILEISKSHKVIELGQFLIKKNVLTINNT